MNTDKLLRAAWLTFLLFVGVLVVCSLRDDNQRIKLGSDPKVKVGRFVPVTEEKALDTATGRICYNRPHIHNDDITIPQCSELVGSVPSDARIIW